MLKCVVNPIQFNFETFVDLKHALAKKNTIGIYNYLCIQKYRYVYTHMYTYISDCKMESWLSPICSSFFATLVLTSGNSSSNSESKGALK